MIRRGHLLAIALVLLSSALVFVRVAADRREPPEASVWLTERELPLVPPEMESSFLFLSLRIQDVEASEKTLLDASFLRELGFDTSVAPDDERANEFYARQLARPAWVAVELEGDAWQRRERDEPAARDIPPAQKAQESRALDERIANPSHLLLVDAGSDAAELRRRHPDRERVLVLPVHVRAFVHPPQRDKPRLFFLGGRIIWRSLEVAVPTPLRHELAGFIDEPHIPEAKAGGVGEPRYRAQLVIGQRHLPRFGAIERLSPSQ